MDVALLPRATRWRAGEHLRLDVGGTWPQPRNPVTGQFPSGYARSPRGSLVLHTGGVHVATLTLPVRPVDAVLGRGCSPAHRESWPPRGAPASQRKSPEPTVGRTLTG